VIRSSAEISTIQPPGILAAWVVTTYDLPVTGRSGRADPAGERAERCREAGFCWSVARRRLKREPLGPGFAEQSLPVSETVSLDVV
jgi:hypothetical protein